MPFTARELIQASHASLLLGNPHDTFEGLSIDTRTIQKGSLFFAIPGPHHNGHDHLEEAFRKGASGVVVETVDERLQFNRDQAPAVLQVANSVTAIQQWARALRLRSRAVVIGITGSNGKTTTKEMISAILSRTGKTLATRGNLNNHLGLPLTLSQIQPEHRFAVLEMGASREGDIALLADIGRPQIGVITNIGHAHLQGLHSAEGVLKEKRALFDSLPIDGMAVINQDDPYLAGIAKSVSCRKIFFGLSALADVRADAIQEEDAAVRFTLYVRGQRTPVRLPVPGRFQVFNALAAAATAHSAGASLEDIALGLTSFQPVAMRMQALSHSSGALLINDAYNANPSSVRASVQSLTRGYLERKRWFVLGDMRELGAESHAEHRELGVWLASQPLDRIFLYGRETRFTEEGLKTKTGPLRIVRYRQKRKLLADLERSLTEKPVILFKGSRSMKLEDLTNALTGVSTGKAH